MVLSLEKKMSENGHNGHNGHGNYDFLEDIFTSMSDKWHAKDRAISLNNSVRRNINYLTYLMTVIDAHQETRKMQLDFTPFVAGYHYMIDNIDDFNTMVQILIRTYGARAFTERPEAEIGLNPTEYMEREHFFKACAVEYVRNFLHEMCSIKGSAHMSIEQVLKQSIFWIFRMLVICMFYMEESYVQHYLEEDDVDDFLDNFHSHEDLEDFDEKMNEYFKTDDDSRDDRDDEGWIKI